MRGTASVRYRGRHPARRWTVLVRLAVALAGVAIGAAVVAGAPAGPAGELRVGVSRLPESLDPALASGPGLVVLRQMFQGLVEASERGDLEPGLATQWTISRDGLTWTFRLRPDVQFHNGASLTADIVVASLGRHLSATDATEPAEPWLRLFRGKSAIVRGVRRGPSGTVEIQLTQPFSPLLAALAHPALAIAVTQIDSPVPFFGTGPYRLVERTPGRMVLEAADPAEAVRPARLVFEETADDAAAIAELQPGGRLDVLFPRAPPAFGGLGLQVVTAPTRQVGLLVLRSQTGVLVRKPVRQAIAIGLDPALVGPALGRMARPHAAYLPPGAWAVRTAPSPVHDAIRARRLLAEARAGAPTLTLLAPEASTGVDTARLAEAIRLSLAVAGITVPVRQATADVYLQALRQGEGELALMEVEELLDDPHFVLRPLVASDGAIPGAATNVAFYRNPVADGMLQRASQLGFRPERLRLYQRLQAQLAEDLPYLPLYVRLQWAVARPGVRDLRLEPGGRHRLDRVWIEAPPEPVAPAPAVAAPPAPPPLAPLPPPAAPLPPPVAPETPLVAPVPPPAAPAPAPTGGSP
jgi:peptide/nickel transport system substrate-binding protein